MIKKSLSLIIAFVLCFTFTFSTFSNNSYGASTNALIKELRKNTNYYYDLNGNGKRENVFFTTSCKKYASNKYKHTINLYVNNKLLKTKSLYCDFDAWTFEVNLYDFNKSDKYKDLVVDLRESMALSYLSLWRYNSGKFKEYSLNVRDIPRGSNGYTRDITTTKSDGYVTLAVDYIYGDYFMDNCYTTVKYKVDKNGVHKPTSYTFNTQSYIRNCKYKTAYGVTAYTSALRVKKAFTLKKNEVVRIYAVYKNKYGSVYVRVKNSKNRYGWVKVGNKKLFKNTVVLQ